jgi:RibD C-terminal domain
MTKLRVNCFSISLDGYGAGPEQDLANPLGVGGMALHQWVFATRTFKHLRAALIDEMHLAISPVLLGSGEHLLAGIDTLKLGLQCTEHVASANATHVVLTRRT